MSDAAIRAVFFDVDFTLIRPGPRFEGAGYADVCATHGVAVDAARFEAAVARALPLLDDHGDPVYDHGVFIRYTAAIIEHMGGQGEAVTAAATEIYDAWATNHHFDLYDDVHDVLPVLAARGLRLGVISNSHRSLEAFTEHFALDRYVRTHISAHPNRRMKPPRQHLRGGARRRRRAGGRSVDGRRQLAADVEGARRAGLRAVWLRRGGDRPLDPPPDVPIIRRLDELPAIIWPAIG